MAVPCASLLLAEGPETRVQGWVVTWGVGGENRRVYKGVGAMESALPKAAFRPQSDCLWPQGMAETGTKFQRGESLSAYLQTG